MRTVIDLPNSNCTWCRDTMIEHLTARPLVRQVHVNSTTGCLVVDHDHDSPTALVEEIHDDLSGWELADNGEKVMKTGSNPAVIAKVIVAAATDPKPKLRYTAGKWGWPRQRAPPPRPARIFDKQIRKINRMT